MKVLHRKKYSPLARRLSLVPVYLLLWPLFKLFELTGHWPQKWMPAMMKKVFIWPEQYQPGAHDVVVCSYFKSGTNWMLQIATQIAWRGRAEFAHIHDLVPWPEFVQRVQFTVKLDDVDPASSPSGLRIIKSHFTPGVVPLNDEARYICVVRDPKSVFESSYHFIRNSSMGPLMPSEASWLNLFLSKDAMYGSWSDFTANCWALRDRRNVLFLTYEQMKQDLPGTVKIIAAFMGVALSEDEFSAVVDQASFAHMKKIDHKFDPIGVGPPWATPTGAMLRKGSSKSGDELVPGANARIDEWCRRRLVELQSDFAYDSHYGAE